MSGLRQSKLPDEAKPEAEVWSLSGALHDLDVRRAVMADLVAGMPSFAVGPYFEEKENIFDECDILVVGTEPSTGVHVGILAAKWMQAADGFRFLFFQTILIAERYQRTKLIKKLNRGLFERIHARSEPTPDVIAFKTYNPRSFVAMAVFARLANVEMYPDVSGGSQADHAIPMVCRIAKTVSPDCPFDPHTGVIQGAALGRSREFYREMPMAQRSDVNLHFTKNLVPADRILCCITFGTEESKRKMLKLFGVQSHGS